ncbi:MAG: hypothetical protein Kow0056_04950 [Coriobacteriia bacterium]
MSRFSRRRTSLATQVSVTALGLVAAAVFVASVLAVAGVYGLARSEADARLEAFRDVLADDIESRFLLAGLVIDSTVAHVGTAEDESSLRDGVYRIASANTDYMDTLLLADDSGEVLVAWPPAAAPRSFVATEVLGVPVTDSLVVAQEVTEGLPEQRIWMAERTASRYGDVIVAGRVRTAFVELLVEELASEEEGRSVLVVDTDGDLVAAGGPSRDLPLSSIEWEAASGEAGGRVRAEQPGLGRLDGFYADVDTTGELGWRVVVFEPRSLVLRRTQEALTPASFVVLVAVVVSLVVAYLFGRRLAKPLRMLEDKAREVATGSYIRPIQLDREDEVGRLAAAFNEMSDRLNALQDLSQVLANAGDLGQVLDTVLMSMESLLGTGRAAIFLDDEEGRVLRLAKATGARLKSPGLTVAVAGPSWVSQAYRTGRTIAFVMSPDDAVNDPVVGLFATDEASSGLAVPLSIGHRPFGAILIVADGRRQFTEAEREMAGTFAAQAAIAVQNSTLFEEEHRSRTEAEALREMSELLVSSEELESTLNEVGKVAASLLSMAGHRLVMDERQRRWLDLGPSDDPTTDQKYLALWREAKSEYPDRRPADAVALEAMRNDPLSSDLAIERGIESALLIPMLHAGQEIGVLVLECVDPARRFSGRDMEVAYATSQTVAIALDSAVLYRQAEQRAQNLANLFKISQAVSRTLQSKAVLDSVMEVIHTMLLPGTGACLMSFDRRKGVLTTTMLRGVDDRRLLEAEVKPGEGVVGEAFETREPVNIPDVSKIRTPMADVLASLGYSSWLCVPLVARGQGLGILSVFSKEQRAFLPEDIELVTTFASQAALALDTAAMFERERSVAKVLQASIVPEVLLDTPWLETESEYQPAGSESEIGGDYYDLFPDPDGRLVLAIGDVCGKGVQAATRTSVIKYTLRGLVAAGLGPGEAMAELNRVVGETGDISDIVTMWVGALDPKTDVLEYCGAGHPPVLMREPSGSLVELGSTGPLLGATEDAQYGVGRVSVAPGSLLFLYTDGVTEARGSTGLFGEERLREVLLGVETAQEVVDSVVAAVRTHTGNVLRDDVAMLAVRYKPSEGVIEREEDEKADFKGDSGASHQGRDE